VEEREPAKHGGGREGERLGGPCTAWAPSPFQAPSAASTSLGARYVGGVARVFGREVLELSATVFLTDGGPGGGRGFELAAGGSVRSPSGHGVTQAVKKRREGDKTEIPGH